MASKRQDDLSAERATLKNILLALWWPWKLPSQGRPQPFPVLFPFEWLFMPFLFLIAIFLLNVTSDAFQKSLQMRYESALREADIVCEQLAAYGSSIADQCALRRQNNDTWESDFPMLSGMITLLRDAGILDKAPPPRVRL